MPNFAVQDPSLYGMMIYHRNRLIRPYHRVGMQLEPNDKGVGVLGVVQADYLEPTHNKQVRIPNPGNSWWEKLRYMPILWCRFQQWTTALTLPAFVWVKAARAVMFVVIQMCF